MILYLEHVINIEGENIIKFYQKEIPKEVFDEDAFFDIVNDINIEDDLLTDLEKLYKLTISMDRNLDINY